MWRSLGILLLPAGLISAMVAWQVTSADSPPLADAASAGPCQQSPHFKVAYQIDSHATVPQGNGFTLFGVSWIEATTCTPGTLTVTAHGDVAGGAAPVLQVILAGRLLAVESFSVQRTIRVNVPKAGRLILGYFNDYYLADVRIAVVDKVKFEGSGCSSFQASVPEATGGQWYSKEHLATLVSNVPMTLTPCNAGKFTFILSGRKGNKKFPYLKFFQHHSLIKEFDTSAKQVNVNLEVDASPLSIYVDNPYGRTLDDRNLYMPNIDWKVIRAR